MNQFIQKHFVLFIVISMILGFIFDSYFLILGKITLQLLTLLMLTSFLGMNFRLFFERIKKPGIYLLVFLLLKVILPAGLYYIIRPFHDALAVGALLLSAAPAGGVSPSLTRLCKGDSEFIIGLLIFTTVISPFTLPFTMNILAGANMEIDTTGMIRTMVILIIIPMTISILAKRYTLRTVEKIEPYLSSAAVIILSLMLLGLTAQGASTIKANQELTFLFGSTSIALGSILTLAGYFLFPFLDRQKRTGLSVSSLYVNIGLIIVLAYRYFPEKVMIFTLYYMIPANLFPGILRKVLQRGNSAEGIEND